MAIKVESMEGIMPGFERVLIKPDIDDRRTSSGVFIQGEDHEQESGEIVAVSDEAAKQGYEVGQRIAYIHSSRESFEVEGTGEKFRVAYWQSIAAILPNHTT